MAIQFVGSTTANKAGASSGNTTISLTGLTGGIAAAAAVGDIVVAAFATGATADQTLLISDGTTAYTLIGTELYANSGVDTNLRVAYKVMGATPDTTTTFGPTGSAQDGGAMVVSVWRGVDTVTPLDVAATTATGTTTGRPDPASITPSTAGAVAVIVGGSAAATGATYTSSDLTGFKSDTGADTNDAMIGLGYFAWTSGPFDAAQFGGGTTGGTDSWAAVSLALRPMPVMGTIQYVGGVVGNKAGASSGNTTLSLTGLTGGIGSSAAANDIVIAVFATGSTVDRTLAITDGTSNYTLIGSELYSAGVAFSSSLRVAYKIMGGTPDTTTTFGPTGDAADGGAMAIHVYRGVDTTTPLDATATTATGTGTSAVNPASITPVTAGALVVAAGGGAASTGAPYTTTDLYNFLSTVGVDSNDGEVGIGWRSWTSGALDPAVWTGGTAGSNDAWCAVTLALRPAASGTPVGRSDETDSALALAGLQITATGLSTETETALALGGKQILATGVATEADSAQALTPVQLTATGRANETDAAQALGSARPAGQASETDAAQALSGAQVAATGRADETDTAEALGVARPVGLATGTEAALALAAVQIAAAGLANETDSAQALAGVQGYAPGVGTETDSAQALSAVQIAATGRADETDTAFAEGATDVLPVGKGTETDTAAALAAVQIAAAGRAEETDAALALGGVQIAAVRLAEESDTAFAEGRTNILPTRMATEVDEAEVPTSPVMAGSVGLAVETDSALSPVPVQEEKPKPLGIGPIRKPAVDGQALGQVIDIWVTVLPGSALGLVVEVPPAPVVLSLTPGTATGTSEFTDEQKLLLILAEAA